MQAAVGYPELELQEGACKTNDKINRRLRGHMTLQRIFFSPSNETGGG